MKGEEKDKAGGLVNGYLRCPLKWDLLVCAIIILCIAFFAAKFSVSTKDISSVQNSLAGTAISLAGFILTALTIIVTLRANLAFKGLEQAKSGLELIFNSWAYQQIVDVFKGAIQELVITALVLYGAMLCNKNEKIEFVLLSICAGGIFVIGASTFRCLYILFLVIDTEIADRKKQPKPMPERKKWRVKLDAIIQKDPDELLPDEFSVELTEEDTSDSFRPY